MKIENRKINIKKIFDLFPDKFKKKSLFFIFLSILASIVETLSIGAIFPLIEILIKGDLTKNYFGINFDEYFFNLEFSSIATKLIIFILYLYLLKTVFLIFFNYWQLKFSQNIYKHLSFKLLTKYLFNPITFYHKKNSSVLLRNVMFETKNYGVVINILLKLIVEILIIIFIIGLIIYLEPKTSIVLCLVLIIFGLIFYFLTSKKIYFFGVEKVANTEKAIKVLSETFGGIRDIKLKSAEYHFLHPFKNFLSRFIKVSNYQQAITDSPKILFEFILVLSLLVSLILYLRINEDVANYLSILGLYVVASFRLVPAVMRVLNMLQTIRGLKASIDMLNNELGLDKKIDDTKKSKLDIGISFEDKIEFQNLSFSYNSKNFIFENFSHCIKKNQITGISGKSGSGKSTLIDLLTGLLSPTKGKIIIDNKLELKNENVNSWQKKIGYVSQNVFLLDATLRQNIAFGVKEDLIDDNKIFDVLKYAELYDFVSKLDKKLDTQVGERGVKFSGGQIQRIGIARELYREPELIIFDESTSALDTNTENQIIDCIKKFRGSVTTIIISHRDNILKICDQIIKI